MSEIYPTSSHPTHHPARTMPVGGSRSLTPSELAQIEENISYSQNLPIKPPAQYHFHLITDGTWNKRGDLELSGNVDDTVPALIGELINPSNAENIHTQYEAGVGTGGWVSQYVAGSFFPTREVMEQGLRGYDALVHRANIWASESTADLDIRITAMTFSRGGPAFFAFAKNLEEKAFPTQALNTPSTSQDKSMGLG